MLLPQTQQTAFVSTVFVLPARRSALGVGDNMAELATAMAIRFVRFADASPA
jgi:hypothetical protein